MLLNVKNLSKTVKNRVILSDVSFEVNEGEIVGLVGPNGAGKTKGVIDLSQIEEVVLIMITSDNAYAKLCIEENYKYPVELQKDSLNIKVVIKRHDFNSIIECIKGNNISIYDIKTENPLENQYLALMGGNIID